MKNGWWEVGGSTHGGIKSPLLKVVYELEGVRWLG